ncbi:tRNA pseudouridine(38-40) synthase TruA [Acetivibrio ethanolgignens]|uniref:tRNA pseudouridine synthase A n=1 Tax=Acetivibrio ethanolgignens TaxID=290052 RepID=A0A0V8QGA3_9FIRM|nr:tRNA pseudouridine(38-40) synthase TruA [Acetivibrio ethanolgignens]KSV59640.1 pseudouridine synthase [Acetivibrio ethanolgignens]
MKRYMLEVAYDGTNYCGWQVQPGKATIEGELNKALSDLLKQEIEVIGASRTDSGVHGLGNVAVFDAETRIPGEKLKYALNQRLPEDIRVQTSREVASDFHPRHCDSKKTYEYRILCREVELPTERLYAHFTYRKLNLERMQRAATYVVGEHDFKSFCSAGSQVKETVRTVYSLTVEQEEDLIKIRITGSGFLYNMVRIIAGTLMEVGVGAIEPDEMREIIAGCDRGLAGPTAPARGLRLVKIEYIHNVIKIHKKM